VRLRLVAVGTRVPEWVRAGFEDYARRLPADNRLELTEIPPARGGAGRDAARLRGEEGDRIRRTLRPRERVVALDAGGCELATEAVAERLRQWRMDGRDVALLVGGPEGLDHGCLEAAEWVWSLSPLTLPHSLVRIVVAEQVYRAWSLIVGHPYHR